MLNVKVGSLSIEIYKKWKLIKVLAYIMKTNVDIKQSQLSSGKELDAEVVEFPIFYSPVPAAYRSCQDEAGFTHQYLFILF